MMFGMPTAPPWLARHRTKLLVAIAAVLLVTIVGPFVYIHLIQGDPPERLSLDDVPAATSTTAEPSATVPASADGLDGAWSISGGSQAGYRVKEVLFGQDTTAVGRTSDVTGTLAVSGTSITATDVTVDMTTVASNESRRDGQFRDRIMSTDQFPTATFTLTKPIALGSLPADGETVSAKATGDLALRGVTRSVTFELSAKRRDGTIVVNGTIPVDFDDYDIPDASGGPASVGRSGEIELLLVFAR
jgi:polyisoprenoid-binding protein YceI